MARAAKRSSFKYQPPSEKALKERANRQGGNFDSIFKQGIDTWRPKAGDNYIRILPATWENPEHYALSVWLHRSIGPDNSTYLCLDKMKGKPCPICEAAVEAKAAGEDDEAKELKAKENFICYIIDRDEKKAKPLVWTMSWTLDRDFAALAQQRKGGVINIDDPENGHDVSFKRTGEKLRTRYSALQIEHQATPVEDNERRHNDILAEIEEMPLDKILVYKDYDYLEKMLSGTATKKDDDLDDEKPKRRSSRDDDDDEDEKPRSRRRGGDDDEEEDKPRRRRAAKDDDEEEDEDESPRSRRSKRDDDDEEEERPRRRTSRDDDEDEKPSRSRRRSSDDDDDEDEKPSRRRSAKDDDDEEDERPKRRRAAKDDDEEEEEDTRGKARRGRGGDDDEDDTPPRRRR